MAGGRPTKYNDDLIERAPEYLENWEAEGDLIPSQAGLAVFLKISISCVEKWSRQADKQEFLRVLDEIEVKQRSLLINRGLSGDFNSAIAKLVLGKHGFSDKQELTGKDGGAIELTDLSSDALDRKIARLSEETTDDP